MTMIAGILLQNGLRHVEEIRTSLMSGAFLFTLAGFVEGAWLAGEDMKGHLFNIVKVALVAGLVAAFPTMIQKGDEALSKLHTSIAQKQEDAFQQELKINSAEPSWTDIAGRISYYIGICLQKIGFLGYQFVYWAKDLSILLLISVSPLLIGFLAFSYTRSIGINFLMTSLTIVLWNIGFAIVDTLLVFLGNVIMPVMGAGTTGAAGVVSGMVVTAGPQFLVLCLVAATLPIFMYCAVPIITGAIMRGSNVAGAAMSAYSMAHRAISHTGAGHGAGRGASVQQGSGMGFHPPVPISSLQSSGSSSGTSRSNSQEEGGSSSLSDGVGAKGPRGPGPHGPVAKASSISSSTSSGGDVSDGFSITSDAMDFSSSPSIIPTASPLGTIGSSVASPDRFMTATQSDHGMISVTDSKGGFSSRPGNIADSITVQAAFYSHEATTSSL